MNVTRWATSIIWAAKSAGSGIVLAARAYDVSFTTPYGTWIDLFAGYERTGSLAASTPR